LEEGNIFSHAQLSTWVAFRKQWWQPDKIGVGKWLYQMHEKVGGKETGGRLKNWVTNAGDRVWRLHKIFNLSSPHVENPDQQQNNTSTSIIWKYGMPASSY
jgi:hypothetical protein